MRKFLKSVALTGVIVGVGVGIGKSEELSHDNGDAQVRLLYMGGNTVYAVKFTPTGKCNVYRAKIKGRSSVSQGTKIKVRLYSEKDGLPGEVVEEVEVKFERNLEWKEVEFSGNYSTTDVFFIGIIKGENRGAYLATDRDGGTGNSYFTFNNRWRQETRRDFCIRAIVGSGPSITVISPNGGETWIIGKEVEIKWESVNFTRNVNIQLKRGNGSYTTIISNVSYDASPQKWTVTGPEGSGCKVKVVAVDGSVEDESDGDFVIRDPQSIEITVKIPQNIVGSVGGKVDVPVEIVDDITDKGIDAIDLKIEFNKNILKPVKVVKEGTMVDGWTIFENFSVDGIVRVGGFSTQQALKGKGVLVKVQFEVLTGGECDLLLKDVELSKSNPPTSYPVKTEKGHLTAVLNVSVAGKVLYCKEERPISGAKLVISGEGITKEVVTGEDGGYKFEEVLAGKDYKVTVSKENQQKPDAIMMNDAAIVAREVIVGGMLNEVQKIAGNVVVDGDDELSMIDAVWIAKYVLEIEGYERFPVGDWKFDPPSREYKNLSENKVDENYIGILYGDANSSFGKKDDRVKATLTLGVELPERKAKPGETIWIPILIKGVEGKEIVAAEISIQFEKNLVEAVVNEDLKPKAGEIADGWNVQAKLEDNVVKVGAFSASELKEDGEFLLIPFIVKEDAPIGGKCELKFVEVSLQTFQDDVPVDEVEDGKINIVAAVEETRRLPEKIEFKVIGGISSAGEITFVYSLPKRGEVELKIYDISGKLVTEVKKVEKGGIHQWRWDVTGIQAGLYFSRLKVNGELIGVKKVVLLQ